MINEHLSPKGLNRLQFARNSSQRGIAGGSSRSEAKQASSRSNAEKARAIRRKKLIAEGKIFAYGDFQGTMRACRHHVKHSGGDYSLITKVENAQ